MVLLGVSGLKTTQRRWERVALAIWTGLDHTFQVLNAADEWRKRCLLGSASVLSDKNLWTHENIKQLKTLFVDNPIHGSRSFFDKLREQISGAKPEISQLASEAIWLLLLFVSERSFGIDTKRERISEVWRLSGEPLPQPQRLTDESLRGLANPGTAFLTRIWAEYGFLLSIIEAWKSLAPPEQSNLLSDEPWNLCEWITNLEGRDVRAFRHMFLYFCYPTNFERICSRGHKKKIHAAFANRLEDRDDPYKSSHSLCCLDKSIFEIRKVLQEEHATEELDFYEPPLRSLWLKTAGKTSAESETEAESQAIIAVDQARMRFWVEKALVGKRSDRQNGPYRVGVALWSPQKSQNGRDIYAILREVSKDDVVLHLTDNTAFTGVSIAADKADDSFGGVAGTEWGEQASYRVPLSDYQVLDPPLPLDRLFSDPDIRQIPNHGLFFNKQLQLNQDAYLTEAPASLIKLLDRAYQKHAGRAFPHIGSSGTDPPFTLKEAVKDLFLDLEIVERILTVWRGKKNLILQGPPGVGKTFVARRLAFALMGIEAPERLDFVQFHQSYSYEDFIQGYRPSGSGFKLRNGIFFNFCRRAAAHPDHKYVFIIDEINRGNLSKIFGELMVLIEADKRGSRWSIPLAYGEADETFFVPENVYLLGLMNTADRSLAVVDYALRRRFGFIDLKPQFDSEKFHTHLRGNGISDKLINLIRQRLGGLNQEIGGDQANLGSGFCIGHSFFCSERGELSEEDWYQLIIETEVIPLLAEYWFDSPDRVDTWQGRLLSGV